MGKYKTYGKYKPSDLEWIGEVPEHWLFLSLKWVVEKRITDGPHETPELLDDGVIFISAEAVENGKINFNRARGFISREQHNIYAKKCLPKRDDIFIVKSGSTTGKVAYVDTDIEFNIWSPLALIRTKKEICNSRFLFYALTSDFFQKQVQLSWSFGTQPNIGMGVIENLKVSLPPIEEQKQIAHFLDLETTRIDTLITKKRQLIALLQKKRDAMIYEVVTKGINPESPAKDTDLPWIPKIPERWLKTKIKFVCSSVRDGTHNPPARAEGEYRLLSARNIQDGEFILREDDRLMDLAAFKELERSYTVRKGDVVVAVVGATTGKSAVVSDLKDISVQRSVAILRPEASVINPHYLNFWITNTTAQHEIKLVSLKYAAQGGIYLEDLANITCVLPPLKEQEEILKFLKKVFVPIVKMKQKLEEQLKELDKYRTALVTAAVTGKIDVREEAN